MKTTLKKLGDDVGLRIPRAIARRSGLAAGQSVDVALSGDEIRLRKSAYRLEELVGQITCHNRRGELDWGKPSGKEVW
jgi:antitoxin MazE